MTIARLRKPKEEKKEDTYKPLADAWEKATFDAGKVCSGE